MLVPKLVVDAKQINGKIPLMGIYAGYNFDKNFCKPICWFRRQREFNAGVSPGKGDVKSFGAYGTYRYNFINTPFYAKGKLGITKD